MNQNKKINDQQSAIAAAIERAARALQHVTEQPKQSKTVDYQIDTALGF